MRRSRREESVQWSAFSGRQPTPVPWPAHCGTPRQTQSTWQSPPRRTDSEIESRTKLIHRHSVVKRDTFENAAQRAGFEGIVGRYGLVVFAVPHGGDAYVRALLPRYRISKRTKSFDEVGARHVARQSHTASTSSRTKCNLTMLGTSSGLSKWHSTASRTLRRSSSNVSPCV